MSGFSTSNAFYRAIMVELERKRIAMGLSQDRLSELMGVAERSYAKMVWPDSASGRLATWDKLQKAIEVLFADGFEVVVRAGMTLTDTTPGTKRLIRQAAAHYDRRGARELMRDLALLRHEKVPKWRREQIARKAGRASGKKRRQNARKRKSEPIILPAEHARKFTTGLTTV
jgi:hypothetical protein